VQLSPPVGVVIAQTDHELKLSGGTSSISMPRNVAAVLGFCIMPKFAKQSRPLHDNARVRGVATILLTGFATGFPGTSSNELFPLSGPVKSTNVNEPVNDTATKFQSIMLEALSRPSVHQSL